MFSEACHAENEQLVARINAGIDTANNMLALYLQNRGIIYQIAKKYAGMAEFDDLTQEGYIGLCLAVDKYKPAAGASFSSYAWKCINSHLLRYIYQQKDLPEYMQALIGQYKKLDNAFMVRYGRKPQNWEYCHYLDITQEQLRQIKKSIKMEQIASIDSPIGDEDMVLSDTLVSDTDVESEVLDEVQQAQLRAELWQAVDELPGELSELMRKRYQDNMTLQGTGESMGISRDKVRAEEGKALRILRRNDNILSFGDDYIATAAMHGTGAERFNRTWTSSTERVAMRLAE